MLRGLLGGFARGRRQTSAATLVLDFLAGLNDSRITYSGGANGTRVNSSGLIVAATTPRFDYDPVTLAAKGLLVEEARTNLLLQSENLATTWATNEASISSNATTSPDGTANADALIPSTNNSALHRVDQSSQTVSAGATVTLTLYLKSAGYNFLLIRCGNAGETAAFQVEANLGAGTLGTATAYGAGGAVVSSSIAQAGNGWYRVSLTGSVTTVTSYKCSFYCYNATGAPSFAGNGTSGIYIWGTQLEAGSFPTSYIPTTSASVTRTADSAVMTGTNFSSWYNQSEGTFVVSGDLAFPASGGSQFLARASDNSYNNSVAANCSSTGFGATNTAAGGVFDGNASVTNIFVANTVFKMASSYAANNLACCVDGQTVATDATATIPSGLTRLDIGADHGGFNRIGSGHIRSIAYYPTARPNSLQALTA